jgi:diacylglycerol kinase family enzyme
VDHTVAVFFNPAAGAASRQDLPSLLPPLFAELGLAAALTPVRSHAQTREAVRAASAGGAAAIVVAGGDGTISSVAADLLDGRTALGVLPLGTLNHFAKDAGIPIDLREAVRTIANGHVRRVDVGEVNGRAFLNNSSLGIYPDIVVARDALRKGGYRKWTAFAVATAKVVHRYRGVIVRVSTADAARVFRTPFLFIGNNEYQVEGLQVGRRQRLDGGQLFVYMAPRLYGRDLPKLAALALAGRATENPALQSFAAGSLDVETPGRYRIRVALDGEVHVLETPLRYRIRPAALPLLVPKLPSV